MKKIAFICMLPFLVSCSTTVDPATKTAVIEPKDRPSLLTLSMNANSKVNPNIYNDNVLAVQAEEPQAPVEKQSADPQKANANTIDPMEKLPADPQEEAIANTVDPMEKPPAGPQEETTANTVDPVEKLPADPQEANANTIDPMEKLPADPQEANANTIDQMEKLPADPQEANANTIDQMEKLPADPQEEAIANTVDPMEKLPADPQETNATTVDQETVVAAAPEETFKPEATPIAFKIIQLKDNSLFLQADFEGLFTDMEKALGTTYLTHDDFMLVPNEFKFVEPFEVEDRTRYVAVAAAYNNYANKQWKGIVKIKPKGREYSLLLHFNEQQVVIKKQEL
jgi:type VI secretion system protein VasD